MKQKIPGRSGSTGTMKKLWPLGALAIAALFFLALSAQAASLIPMTAGLNADNDTNQNVSATATKSFNQNNTNAQMCGKVIREDARVTPVFMDKGYSIAPLFNISAIGNDIILSNTGVSIVANSNRGFKEKALNSQPLSDAGLGGGQSLKMPTVALTTDDLEGGRVAQDLGMVSLALVI